MPSLEEFRATLADPAPPVGSGPALEALWWVGKGDWEQAHELAGAHEGESPCDLVHAHLHRRRGDDSALSWYADSGEPPCDDPIDVEWDALVRRMLARPAGA